MPRYDVNFFHRYIFLLRSAITEKTDFVIDRGIKFSENNHTFHIKASLFLKSSRRSLVSDVSLVTVIRHIHICCTVDSSGLTGRVLLPVVHTFEHDTNFVAPLMIYTQDS